MNTAAVYIRVSTEDQTEHSPDSQLKEIQNYAKCHDMFIDAQHIYSDAGISGRNAGKRPAFQRMISAAKNRPSPFDTVLVWKFSRFARNQEESILYKSLLNRECDVEVISITEETGDSIFGPLIERIIEWMDEFYSVRLSEEVRTKMAFVAEKGRIQTIAPFGYVKKPNEKMVPEPVEAHWVRYIFEQFVAGKSLLGIARDLNNRGIRTHRGNQFENRTVEYILHNPMYIGYVRWTPTGKTLSKRIYDSEDTLTVKSDFAPIIAEALFHKVAELLSQRKKTRKKYAKPEDLQKHWLSGMVHCSNCGATLAYSPANHGFQCYKYAKGVCKVSHYISASKLEDAVTEALRDIRVTAEFVRFNTKTNQEETADYSVQISRLERMLDKAKFAYVEGIDTIDEYSISKRKISAEIEGFKALESKISDDIQYRSKEDEIVRLVTIISIVTGNFTKKEKHDALLGFVERIEFSKEMDTVKLFFYL